MGAAEAASRRVGNRLRLSALSSETHGLQAHRPVPGAGGQLGRHERLDPGGWAPHTGANLFGYTGGATLACTAAGAHVTHVDASKGMVAWGRENAAASGLADRPMRWLVDDCGKFVQREQRRGNTYDAILMDPPSYGRGPGGEVWKLEEQIYDLVEQCAALLSDRPLFFAINSYTTGLSPSVMQYILGTLVSPKHAGVLSADEIGLPVTQSGLVLPCGATALWTER